MLQLDHIGKKFKTFSLEKINLSIKEGTYFVLLGKSGAGKSLILEIIAGLKKPDTGHIYFKGENITEKPTQDRNFVLVYQDLALFPHLSVYQNISFSLKCHKISKSEHRKRVQEVSRFLHIEHLLSRSPRRLSGGEAQRVALARALVVKPDILLLDEPLSSLDIELKTELQKLLKSINLKGQTIWHVTHDFEEAVALSDNVAVIQQGRIVQSGLSENVFQNPESRFTAMLTGFNNFFKATLYDPLNGSASRYAVPHHTELKIQIITDEPPGEGFVAFRSSDVLLSLQKINSTAANNFSGTVKHIQKKYNNVEVTIDIGIPVMAKISPKSFNDMKIKNNCTVWLSFKASAVRYISKN